MSAGNKSIIRQILTGRTLGLLLGMAVAGAVSTSCNKGGVENGPGFDRQAFLTNYADNLILPAFDRLEERTELLKEKTDAFVAAPSDATLAQARSAWKEAFVAWQYCTAFSFGPAELPLYGSIRESLGTFPVAAGKIEDDIVQGNLSFANYYKDRRGFLAAEYLLFGTEPGQVLGSYLRSAAAENRREYLQKLVNDIHAQVRQANNAWIAAKADFIADDGTEAGSSTSELYNAFVLDFETIKNFELGLPLGLQPGQVRTEPQRVEAYYSGYSVQFMKEHLRAVDLTWRGNSQGGEAGKGFDDYLQTVVGGPELIQSSTTQFAKAMAAVATLPETPLSAQIQQTPEAVRGVHTELQKQTRYFKSELSSLIGIAITFSSGDGD